MPATNKDIFQYKLNPKHGGDTWIRDQAYNKDEGPTQKPSGP